MIVIFTRYLLSAVYIIITVMDDHFVDEVACYSCGEVPDMTGEGGCNLSVTQHNEALSRLTQQNTSKVMGLDSIGGGERKI